MIRKQLLGAAILLLFLVCLPIAAFASDDVVTNTAVLTTELGTLVKQQYDSYGRLSKAWVWDPAAAGYVLLQEAAYYPAILRVQETKEYSATDKYVRTFYEWDDAGTLTTKRKKDQSNNILAAESSTAKVGTDAGVYLSQLAQVHDYTKMLDANGIKRDVPETD